MKQFQNRLYLLFIFVVNFQSFNTPQITLNLSEPLILTVTQLNLPFIVKKPSKKKSSKEIKQQTAQNNE